MTVFIGRKNELAALNALKDKRSASLVVIKGRRRIGKSRLVEEFGKKGVFYSLTGLPPTSSMTAAGQRESFSKQLQRYFRVPVKSDDWWDLLWFLAEQTRTGRCVILLDEIAWMGSQDPTFLGKLRTVWDVEFKKNDQLVLVLCSSVSTWIEKNIISDTGFFGRISLMLGLGELPLQDCGAFWGGKQHQGVSPYEKFKILSVTGGVPRYLEEIQPKLTAEENIRRLCFLPSGVLFHEFEQIFSDLFSKRSKLYKRLVSVLAEGKKSREAIADELDLKVGGVLSGYLDDLVKAGFLVRDYDWRLADGKLSKLSHFRLSDNYLRFYLKVIEPNKEKILAEHFNHNTVANLPAWASLLGLQFENMVLNNRSYIRECLGLSSDMIIADGPYFQRTTHRQPGCQIDYLIQTKHECLYLCEVKFSKQSIGSEVISEVKEKIKRLKRPRSMSCRPVLVHVNGVQDSVVEADYFAKIIDFSDLLR